MLESSRLAAYPAWLIKRLGTLRPHGRDIPDASIDGFSNSDLIGYPNNHNYVVDGGRLVPNFNLYWRSRILEALYATPVDSLLDVGSAKGWFVLSALQRTDCNRALGIDVHAPWIELAAKVATKLHLDGATFRVAFLGELFDNPEAFGAPFNNVLIINTYHYLFWGSGLSPKHFASHEEALSGLHRITGDRVIFANPLEMADVPRETRDIAEKNPLRANDYTTARFLAAAEPYFDVASHGTIGKRNLLVLHKKPRA